MRGSYGCGRLCRLDDACGRPVVGGVQRHNGIARVGAARHCVAACPSGGTRRLLRPSSKACDVGAKVGLEAGRRRRWRQLIVLYSLLGTPYFPPIEGAWLLLEDLDEYLYHVDRMLLAFRLAGVFDCVRGVLVGGFNDLHDNTIADGQAVENPFGHDVRQMLADHVPAKRRSCMASRSIAWPNSPSSLSASANRCIGRGV